MGISQSSIVENRQKELNIDLFYIKGIFCGIRSWRRKVTFDFVTLNT